MKSFSEQWPVVPLRDRELEDEMSRVSGVRDDLLCLPYSSACGGRWLVLQTICLWLFVLLYRTVTEDSGMAEESSTREWLDGFFRLPEDIELLQWCWMCFQRSLKCGAGVCNRSQSWVSGFHQTCLSFWVHECNLLDVLSFGSRVCIILTTKP